MVLGASLALSACVPRRPADRFITAAELTALPAAFPTGVLEASTSTHRQLAQELARYNPIAAMGVLVTKLLRLEHHGPIAILIKECGKGSASYVPGSPPYIKICYQFIDKVNSYENQPSGTLNQQVNTMLVFTTLHEIAHALIDQLDLQLPGNEEDRADQFALLFLTVLDLDKATALVKGPIQFFTQNDRYYESRKNDVHSSDIDRANNAVCMLGRHLRSSYWRSQRTEQQIEQCIAFAEASRQVWNAALAPYARSVDHVMFFAN